MTGCSPFASWDVYRSMRSLIADFVMFGRSIIVRLAGRDSDVVGDGLVGADRTQPPSRLTIGRDRIDFVPHLVEVADEDIRQPLFLPNRDFHGLNGLVVAFDVEVVPRGLPVGGEPVEDQSARFVQGERVPFDLVQVIVRLDPQLLFDPADHVGRQRPQPVNLAFEPIYSFEHVACHGEAPEAPRPRVGRHGPVTKSVCAGSPNLASRGARNKRRDGELWIVDC